MSCKHRDSRDPNLTTVDTDNLLVGLEHDSEKAKIGGELLIKKQKLDQLKRLDDVSYDSNNSAKESNKGGKGLRPRKQ